MPLSNILYNVHVCGVTLYLSKSIYFMNVCHPCLVAIPLQDLKVLKYFKFFFFLKAYVKICICIFLGYLSIPIFPLTSYYSFTYRNYGFYELFRPYL